MTAPTLADISDALEHRSNGRFGIADLAEATIAGLALKATAADLDAAEAAAATAAIKATRLATHVTDGDTSLLTANGGTLTIAAYQIDMSAGGVLVDGTFGAFALLNDQAIVGTGAWTKSFKLDGTAAALLTADGKTYWVALVVYRLNGVPTIYAIFGAEANDASEVAPTGAQCRAALLAANIATLDLSVGLVIARFKIQRVAVDTITVTHTAAAATAALKAERVYGAIFPP